MHVTLTSIQMDKTTQCRASMRTETIEEYADAMKRGDAFPPVDLYGTAAQCWIGDGWHRVLATSTAGSCEVDATLHPGGRSDAIRHALRANATHGVRRTNEDKRRAVEVALAEFPELSSRAVAELCGVGDRLVREIRPTCGLTAPEAVTGRDGKQYPAGREAPPEPPAETEETQAEEEHHKPKYDPYRGSSAMQFADMAIRQLERIPVGDARECEALNHVVAWIEKRRGAKCPQHQN